MSSSASRSSSSASRSHTPPPSSASRSHTPPPSSASPTSETSPRAARQATDAKYPNFVSLLPTDYASTDGDEAGIEAMYDVDPKIWGRPTWELFHLLAYAYPEQPSTVVQQTIYQIFDAMRFALPCTDCRGGYRQRWKEYDIRDYLDSRESLITWIVTVNDAVNKELGVPELRYAEFMERLIGDQVVLTEGEEEEEEDEDGGENESIEHVHKKREAVRQSQHTETMGGERMETTNPHAFAAAMANGESLHGMDPKRLRSRQQSAFAQAVRLRRANSKSTQQRHHRSKGSRRHVSHSSHSSTGSQRRQRERHRTTTSIGSVQDYYSEALRPRGAPTRRDVGTTRTTRSRTKNIGSRVKRPRECENCNRKVMVPSVFS